MTKATLFLAKLVSLALNVLIFKALQYAYGIELALWSTAPLLITFGILVSRISAETPKELYNYNRSETFFNKGGLRDLLRIPVMLFAFTHNIFVWIFYGIYQILILFIDAVQFIKDVLFWILQAIIWFLKLLLPFWRIVIKAFVHYFIKWPWWIYRYSYKNLWKTFNWNVLRVSLLGSFFTLIFFAVFFIIGKYTGNPIIIILGILPSLLPITWTFGEISAIRGQNLLNSPFFNIKSNYKNGIESVRAILIYIAFFIVLFIAIIGLSFIGVKHNWSFTLFGFMFNVNFLLVICLLFYTILMVFGTFLIPTYRLYNEFSELSTRKNWSFLSYLSRRLLQFIASFIPGSFFASLSSIPAIIIVAIALFGTIKINEATREYQMSRLNIEIKQDNISTSERYKLNKEISRLQLAKNFPFSILNEVEGLQYYNDELQEYQNDKADIQLKYPNKISRLEKQIQNTTSSIQEEKVKTVINQTRLSELEEAIAVLNQNLDRTKNEYAFKKSAIEYDISYLQKRINIIPFLFILGVLFGAVVLTLILTFVLGYFGNQMYSNYHYRNDGSQAKWKTLVLEEKENEHNQPLLSTTLNVILAIVIWTLLTGIL